MMKQLIRDLQNALRCRRSRDHIRIGRGCNLSGSSLGGCNRIGSGTRLLSSACGRYSYMGQNCQFSHTEIGRFCSIASDVKLIVGQHPTRIWASTSPAFYSTAGQCGVFFSDAERFDERKYAESERGLYAVIGNDVWIGQDARIMSGVHIGNGAIVAACALVTRDVPDYAIVGGVPARIIGWRFDEETRKRLANFAWWDRDEAWLRARATDFADVNELLKEK